MRHTGMAVSPGTVMGRVWIHAPVAFRIEQREPIDWEREEARFLAARDRAAEELAALSRSFESRGEGERAALFFAQREILLDEELEEEIRGAIRAGTSGPEAVCSACGRYAALLEEMENPILRERGADLRDICGRLLRCWAGVSEKGRSRPEGPVILAARELLPSELAALDRENVLAIVTERGGMTSHTAILARKEGIPAVMGVDGLLSALQDGMEVLVDGGTGELVTEPTLQEKDAWQARISGEEERKALLQTWREAEPVTADGVRLEVALNLTGTDDRELDDLPFADGVGLFRTEFLFLGRDVPPSEEEQYRIYCRVLRACGEKPLVLRTLDAGDDKELEYMASGGVGRGLALCLERPEVFRTQLRAALRASAHGRLEIMFPMVADPEEFRRGKDVLEEVKEELAREGVSFDREVKVGVMVEVPALARQAEQMAAQADFASIGTNDLAQFLLGENRRQAGDRKYRPELFRLVGEVVRAFDRAEKPVTVCGELAGDPQGAAVLIGLGVRRLSMNGVSVPAVKKMIRSMETGRAEELARQVCAMSTAEEAAEWLTGQVPL